MSQVLPPALRFRDTVIFSHANPFLSFAHNTIENWASFYGRTYEALPRNEKNTSISIHLKSESNWKRTAILAIGVVVFPLTLLAIFARWMLRQRYTFEPDNQRIRDDRSLSLSRDASMIVLTNSPPKQQGAHLTSKASRQAVQAGLGSASVPTPEKIEKYRYLSEFDIISTSKPQPELFQSPHDETRSVDPRGAQPLELSSPEVPADTLLTSGSSPTQQANIPSQSFFETQVALLGNRVGLGLIPFPFLPRSDTLVQSPERTHSLQPPRKRVQTLPVKAACTDMTSSSLVDTRTDRVRRWLFENNHQLLNMILTTLQNQSLAPLSIEAIDLGLRFLQQQRVVYLISSPTMLGSAPLTNSDHLSLTPLTSTTSEEESQTLRAAVSAMLLVVKKHRTHRLTMP